jgi:spore maturation protein CgeB
MEKRIVLLGPYFKGTKISLHNAEIGIYSALVELGHNVTVYDYRHKVILANNLQYNNIEIDSVIFNTIMTDDYDLTLCPGAGLPDEVLNSQWWNDLKSLKILWCSEPIRLESYRDKVNKQKKHFDLFFTFDESEIPLYKKIGINALWLPQGYHPDWYHPVPFPAGNRFKDTVVFVGSVGGKWENRVHFLNKVKNLGFNLNVATLFEAKRVNDAYNMHDAVLNLGLYIPESGPPEDLKGYGLQQRIFEAYGSGKVIITNEIDRETNGLFEHGRDILFYNKDNLGEIISFILNKKNRKAMEEYIIENRDLHTYKARMKKLLSLVNY